MNEHQKKVADLFVSKIEEALNKGDLTSLYTDNYAKFIDACVQQSHLEQSEKPIQQSLYPVRPHGFPGYDPTIRSGAMGRVDDGERAKM